MNEFILQNATVFTGTDVLAGASVRVSNGRIQEVSDGGLAGENSVDLAGQWLVPGFVDLQLYGGSELFLNQHPTPQTIEHIYQTHLRHGTTSVLPTLYSTSHAVVLQAIRAVRAARQTTEFGVLGLYVEGPYLNPEKRGAHSATYVRPPDDDELADLVEQGRGVIQILTIAPELFTADQLAYLSASGIRLSAGHTNATYRQATAAFAAGVGLATHLYNAMRGLESREPGVVGAVFDHPTVRASIIVDGFHADFAAVRIAHRLLPDRLFLISDATFAAPPRAHFAYEDFIIRYDEGRYLNQENKLAGSSITLLNAVQNSIRHVGLTPPDVFRMASTLPAEVIGQGDTLGKIRPGYVANLVVLDPEWQVSDVFVGDARYNGR